MTELWQLILLRFFLRLVFGGIIPLRIAYIRQEAPTSMQGEVLGYNTSLRFFGNMIGPILGGFISAQFGYSAVFISTSLLLLSGALMVITKRRHPELASNHH